MSKSSRPYDVKQALLLPPNLEDWVPEDHLARFISDLVDESLDLSGVHALYVRKDGRGGLAYHPAMLVKLLVYGYCTGVRSSRRIERATYDDVAFRFLATDQHPDHDTISAFRKRCLPQLSALFLQQLQDEIRALLDAAERTDKSFTQAYNAQLLPILAMVERDLGRLPEKVSADAGFYSEANVKAEALNGVDLYIPPNQREGSKAKANGGGRPKSATAAAMREKLASPAGKDVYRFRKAIVEPVFGQTKSARGIRHFLFRGLEKVRDEGRLLCLTHNLLKLIRAPGFKHA